MGKPRVFWSWRGKTGTGAVRERTRNELRVRSACEGKTVLVQPRGVATKATGTELRAALNHALELQPDVVILDVSGLLICDEWCRDSLARIHVKATRLGVSLIAPGAPHLLARC